MQKMFKLTNLFALLLLVVSCSSSDEQEKAGSDQGEAGSTESLGEAQIMDQNAKRGFAIINPKSGSDVVGAVTFTEVEGGVRIIADVGGLTEGKHGFHIHESGDCSSDDGSSAGGHFNPTNESHGNFDSQLRHVGDLGNLEANKYGFAHYDRVDSVITIDGENSIVGKSVVIHEGEDDLQSDPTGNSGSRIGCGSIVIVEPN